MKLVQLITRTAVSTLFLGVVFFAIFMYGESHFSTSMLSSSDSVPLLFETVTATTQSVSASPLRLSIPSIGVDASIQKVGLVSSKSQEMGVPTNFTDVGWYTGGVRPGEVGSAVIVGHRSGKHIPKAVFFNIQKLAVDDEVVVQGENNTTFVFKVVAVKTYNHDDVTRDIFSSSDGKAHLNLITCAGDWIKAEALFNKRTVVFTDLVRVSM